MRIRTKSSDGVARWDFTRSHALHVLGLDGTGALHPARIDGLLRIRRGGVRVDVFGGAPGIDYPRGRR